MSWQNGDTLLQKADKTFRLISFLTDTQAWACHFDNVIFSFYQFCDRVCDKQGDFLETTWIVTVQHSICFFNPIPTKMKIKRKTLVLASILEVHYHSQAQSRKKTPKSDQEPRHCFGALNQISFYVYVCLEQCCSSRLGWQTGKVINN